VAQALAAGAPALVIEQPWDTVRLTASSLPAAPPVAVVRVSNSRRALGLLAARMHGDPANRLCVIGVTGTNGKTTTTYLCQAVLQAAGRRVGLIGTVGYQIAGERLHAAHTTPGAVELQSLFARMVRSGLDTAVMEVSSHALAMERTAGCEFDAAVFTNLTQDHLDYHRTMDDYFDAKLKLFTGLQPAGKRTAKRAIVNADDPRGHQVRAASAAPVWMYGIREPADIRAEDVQLSLAGTRFRAATPAGAARIESRLVGEHNVSNVLAAIGVALHIGVPLDTIATGIEQVANVPGRFERVEAGQPFTIVVDYAHTEDALVRLLDAARALRTGRIITVFGCGGDRDRGKRPKMGRAAAERSDLVILTSDNPRTEDPLAILKEVERGVSETPASERAAGFRYEMIPDRRAAIEAAVRAAHAGDTVLIAGKGHEDYQIIGRERRHFDDREAARDAVRQVLVT
jgi:UDP-N-acetylmuramoyl-L-alanyl-D-glutamate--2,6-diaminopimelate ligase